MIELAQTGKEKCILVGVPTRLNLKAEVDESLTELALLADTAGAEVVGRITQDRDHPEPATYIGKGKVEELHQRLKDEAIPLVILTTTSRLHRCEILSASWNAKWLTRSGLILDIFCIACKVQ